MPLHDGSSAVSCRENSARVLLVSRSVVCRLVCLLCLLVCRPTRRIPRAIHVDPALNTQDRRGVSGGGGGRRDLGRGWASRHGSHHYGSMLRRKSGLGLGEHHVDIPTWISMPSFPCWGLAVRACACMPLGDEMVDVPPGRSTEPASTFRKREGDRTTRRPSCRFIAPMMNTWRDVRRGLSVPREG